MGASRWIGGRIQLMGSTSRPHGTGRTLRTHFHLLLLKDTLPDVTVLLQMGGRIRQAIDEENEPYGGTGCSGTRCQRVLDTGPPNMMTGPTHLLLSLAA
jgi:hypothetical protein